MPASLPPPLIEHIRQVAAALPPADPDVLEQLRGVLSPLAEKGAA